MQEPSERQSRDCEGKRGATMCPAVLWGHDKSQFALLVVLIAGVVGDVGTQPSLKKAVKCVSYLRWAATPASE